MSSIEKAISKLKQGKADASDNPVERIDHSFDSDTMDDRFSIDEDGLFRQIDLNVEGLAPHGIFSDETNNQINEEFRIIKQPLLKNAFDKQSDYIEHRNLIMVTSALPNEGKTFTAINLAISIAKEMDKTVLLVDADVSRSGVASVLDFRPELGLSDLLVDKTIRLRDILIKTNIPKLSILSSGSKSENITELISSEQMSSIASELSNRYPDRIIIFDSPPLVVTSETRVLAGMMGQVIIVVESEKTPQSVLEDAVQLLDSSKIIGFVLNKSQKPLGSSYGYGYGYGYNYGSSEKK